MTTYPRVTALGFYWYFDPNGKPPQVVELCVADDSSARLVVLFTGRQDPQSLEDLPGEFVGPIQPPLTLQHSIAGSASGPGRAGWPRPLRTYVNEQ
jgi:hypothetical protein